MNNFGIDNMSFYIPENRITIDELLLVRKSESEQIYNSLVSAKNTTHQEHLRITHPWQDSVCLAAQAMLSLFNHDATKSQLQALRYLVSATETPIDSAKPIAAYLLGILNMANANTPSNILSYQTLHACAGGIISLLETATMMQSSSVNDVALVVTTDIAHYKVPSSAEITQGAGAIAFTVSANPRLLELDTKHTGFFSSDVDDFFRPLGSYTAVVRGRYSMYCYIEAIYHALLDFAKRKNKDIEDVLQSVDYIVAHAPFATMPEIAFSHILKKHLHKSSEETTKFIEKKGIALAASIIKEIGNTYTAAVFLPLGYLLEYQYAKLGNDIIGKKILLVSYGAGNNATILETIIAEKAPEIISNWNLQHQLETFTEVGYAVYKKWCENDITFARTSSYDNPRGDRQVFLKEIREDKYRLYALK